MMDRLDLHGVKHQDVRSMVIRFVERYWNTDTEVEIITGHSERMKSIVKEVLDEYKLKYSDEFLGFKRSSIKMVI